MARKPHVLTDMRVHSILLVAGIAATAGACAGPKRTAPAPSNPRTAGLETALRPVEPYGQQHDPSGWSGPSGGPAPTARGGGPPDQSAIDALDQLRSTPRPSDRTKESPTSPSRTDDVEPPPSPRPSPPDTGPPPPSLDVEWPWWSTGQRVD